MSAASTVNAQDSSRGKRRRMIVQFEAGLEAEGDIARPLRGALAMTSQLFVAVRQQREQSLHAIRAIPPVAPGIELRRFDLGNCIAVSIFIHRLGLRRQEPNTACQHTTPDSTARGRS